MCHASTILKFKITVALATVAQWIEYQPVSQKVAGSNPGQGTCLGCKPGPGPGMCERQLINVSLARQGFSLSPSLPISLKISK